MTKETKQRLIVVAEWGLICVGLPLIALNLSWNKLRDWVQGE